MSYDTLERQIRMLPEECLEDVSNYIEFVIYRFQLSKKNEKPHDLSEYFGALKEMPDGLEEQRRLRDEWN
jgi:hypothetical protein